MSDSSENGPVEPTFDLAEIRMTQRFDAIAGAKKLLTNVPVRKPAKQVFVRAHENPDHSIDLQVLNLKEEGETYLVAAPLVQDLSGELTAVRLTLGLDRQGNIFLWLCRLPNLEGRVDRWADSSLDALEQAKEKWVRVVANTSQGVYEVYQATGNIPDPQWPDESFDEIIKIAFRGRYITSLDHPVIQRLRGAI